MQKVTLMFLPLNWNAGSVSVVTVFRTQETAHVPSHLRKGYQSALYLLLLFSPCPLPSNCCPVRPKYPVPGKVTEPWLLGLHSIRADCCKGRYSPELPRHWSLSATAKQACRSMPRRPLLSHPWKPFSANFWGHYTDTPFHPHTMPLNSTKAEKSEENDSKTDDETVTQRCLGMGLPGWFLILTHSQRL